MTPQSTTRSFDRGTADTATVGPKPQPGVLDIAPYVGGDASGKPGQRLIRLASNETPLGPSPRAVAAFRASADTLHRYPDGGAAALRAAVGAAHGLEPARVVCGSGSDELISLLVQAYAGPGDEVLYSAHGFLMYPISARANGAASVAAPEQGLTTDVDAMLARVTPATRIVFVANPNNPTGTYLPASEMARLRAGLRDDVLLVIDAAYAEYVRPEDYEPGVALVDGAANTVMLRTFSKIYGLAALRVGWAYCPAAVIGVLDRVRGPFNVNSPAQAAAAAAVQDADHRDAARAHNDIWLPWYRERLAGLGLETTESVANFVLARFPDEPGRDAAAALSWLKERGILVRGMAGYGLPGHLRMSMGTEEENGTVIEAVAAFLDARPGRGGHG